MNVEFRLLFLVLSLKIALKFKVVASIVSGVNLTFSLSTEIVVIAAIDTSDFILIIGG